MEEEPKIHLVVVAEDVTVEVLDRTEEVSLPDQSLNYKEEVQMVEQNLSKSIMAAILNHWEEGFVLHLVLAEHTATAVGEEVLNPMLKKAYHKAGPILLLVVAGLRCTVKPIPFLVVEVLAMDLHTVVAWNHKEEKEAWAVLEEERHRHMQEEDNMVETNLLVAELGRNFLLVDNHHQILLVDHQRVRDFVRVCHVWNQRLSPYL